MNDSRIVRGNETELYQLYWTSGNEMLILQKLINVVPDAARIEQRSFSRGSSEPRNCKLLAGLNYGFCLLRDLIDVIVCELSPSVHIMSRMPPFCLEFIRGSEATLLEYHDRYSRKKEMTFVHVTRVSGEL